MKIKSIISALALGLVLPHVSAGVPIPTTPADIIVKTRAGTAEKPTNRNMGFYFKTYNANQKVYIQWGDSTEAQEVIIPKANTLTSKIELKNIAHPDMTVKIWGEDLWFFNCNSDSIYDIKIGPNGKKLTEFRAESNPLTDMSFLNDIDSLFYLTLNNNKLMTKLDLNGKKLARISLGNNNNLADLTLDCPVLYEFKFSQAAALKALDFSKCPKIKTADCYQMASVGKIDLGSGTEITKVQISGNPNLPSQIKSLKISDKPVMTEIVISNFPSLDNLELANLPSLTKLSVTRCAFKTYDVPALPKLATVLFNTHADLTDITFSAKNLTYLQLDNLTSMKEVDLTDLKALKSLYLRWGAMEKIKYDSLSWLNLTNLTLINNHLTFKNIPILPKAYKPEANNYYAPQANPVLPKSLTTDDVIDFSAWATGDNGRTKANTVFTWTTKFEEKLVEGKDFTVNDGKIKFLHEIDDSIFCELTNEAFPKFVRTVVQQTGAVTDNRVMTNYIYVSEGQSGIGDLTEETGDKVKVEGRTFMTLGKKIVTVFDAQGRKVGSGNAVEVKSPGLYIAKCGKKAVKAMIK